MTGESPSVAFYTLGCKLNQYETDALATAFRHRGYSVVDFSGSADAYVINTCTVTNKADRKSRNIINRARRSRRPSGDAPLVIVTGCHTENHRDRLEREEGIRIVGNDEKSRIDEIVDAYLRGEIAGDGITDRFAYSTPERIFHTRGMLKIQDGCDNFCTFCIIPTVRGRARSRPAAEVIDEARRCIDAGYRELVITGVNMSRYDDGTTSFSRLLESVLDLDGEFRVRISSLEPDRLDDRFLDLFAHDAMCPHLHLCAQSGSDRILLAMRRQYTASEYRGTVEALRTRYPGFNLTTDVVVGFPGESEEDFEQTVDLVRWAEFSHVHTFPYSLRTGTRAARMPGQIDGPTKTRRAGRIRELSAKNKRRYRESLVGSTERVLIEGTEIDSGYGEHYVPVRLSSGGSSANQFVTVRITGIDGGDDPSLIGSSEEP